MRRKFSLFLLTVVLVILYFVTTTKIWAAYTFTNIADTTTAAPSGTFTCFCGASPGISGSTVSFYSEYTGGQGIFTGSGGTLTTIVKTGDPAPTATFTSVSGTSISNGSVAFGGSWGSGIGARNGVFTGSGGALTKIASSDDISPNPPWTFSSVGPAVIDGGTVLMAARYPVNVVGLLTSSGGALTPIVKTGDPSPSGVFTNITIEPYSISGGTVAFWGRSTGNIDGIFRKTGEMLTTIVLDGDAAPTSTFSAFGGASVSGETVAFAAYFGADSGIFTGTGGALTKIVKTGDPAPSGIFTSFGSGLPTPAISGGTVAFTGGFPGGVGLFTGSGGPLTTVIKSGDALFGSTVNSVSIGPSGFDTGGSGNLAFTYNLANGRNGIAMASLGLSLPGDYNDDDKVDAADYVVWRKYQNTMTPLPNDPHGGTIGQLQFDTWRANFGNMSPGSGGSSSVPEPETASMLVVGLWFILRKRRLQD